MVEKRVFLGTWRTIRHFRSPIFDARVTLSFTLKFVYRKTSGLFATLFGPQIGATSGHILSENGVDSIQITTARRKTKSELSLHVGHKLIDRSTRNFQDKCKVIQPLGL